MFILQIVDGIIVLWKGGVRVSRILSTEQLTALVGSAPVGISSTLEFPEEFTTSPAVIVLARAFCGSSR